MQFLQTVLDSATLIRLMRPLLAGYLHVVLRLRAAIDAVDLPTS